ncbi:MAG: MOSC domain-containing protein [Acidobacteriota bacterium]|nr:MOSC domain-containing protein [Acidobacteriota bacterium]|tara:strand:+ start:343 stop:786 length:444 start_codon:yes stop_codon:yes gene_type:complete
MGKIEQIWVKRFHRGPMDPVAHGMLVAGQGLLDSADQGCRRQITLISCERWHLATQSMKAPVDPILRRANVLISGIELENTRARLLQLGGCRLRIRGETRPCERMDEAVPGLQDALDAHWGGGAFAEIIQGGEITVGDDVNWENNPD